MAKGPPGGVGNDHRGASGQSGSNPGGALGGAFREQEEIGWAGLPASRDWRGERDRSGRELDVTVQCVVDELAAAANLLMGEGSGGTPAVVARDWEFGPVDGSDEVFRAVETDFVRQALRGWSYVRD